MLAITNYSCCTCIARKLRGISVTLKNTLTSSTPSWVLWHYWCTPGYISISLKNTLTWLTPSWVLACTTKEHFDMIDALLGTCLCHWRTLQHDWHPPGYLPVPLKNTSTWSMPSWVLACVTEEHFNMIDALLGTCVYHWRKLWHDDTLLGTCVYH